MYCSVSHLQKRSFGIINIRVLSASPSATVLYESQHIPLSSFKINAAITSSSVEDTQHLSPLLYHTTKATSRNWLGNL